jgi:hypothetical protein
MTDLDRVRMHLAQAYTRSRDPTVDRHLSAALRELDGEPIEGQLVECLHCGRLGLPEQIADCDCRGR